MKNLSFLLLNYFIAISSLQSIASSTSFRTSSTRDREAFERKVLTLKDGSSIICCRFRARGCEVSYEIDLINKRKALRRLNAHESQRCRFNKNAKRKFAKKTKTKEQRGCSTVQILPIGNSPKDLGSYAPKPTAKNPLKPLTPKEKPATKKMRTSKNETENCKPETRILCQECCATLLPADTLVPFCQECCFDESPKKNFTVDFSEDVLSDLETDENLIPFHIESQSPKDRLLQDR